MSKHTITIKLIKDNATVSIVTLSFECVFSRCRKTKVEGQKTKTAKKSHKRKIDIDKVFDEGYQSAV